MNDTVREALEAIRALAENQGNHPHGDVPALANGGEIASEALSRLTGATDTKGEAPTWEMLDELTASWSAVQEIDNHKADVHEQARRWDRLDTIRKQIAYRRITGGAVEGRGE